MKFAILNEKELSNRDTLKQWANMLFEIREEYISTSGLPMTILYHPHTSRKQWYTKRLHIFHNEFESRDDAIASLGFE